MVKGPCAARSASRTKHQEAFHEKVNESVERDRLSLIVPFDLSLLLLSLLLLSLLLLSLLLLRPR